MVQSVPDAILALQSAPGMLLTKALLHDAALDAAKRNMRRAGRAELNDDDALCFQSQFDRLFDLIGGPAGWIDLPKE